MLIFDRLLFSVVSLNVCPLNYLYPLPFPPLYNCILYNVMLEMTQKFFNEKKKLCLTFTRQYLYENNQEPLNYGPWNSPQDWLPYYNSFVTTLNTEQPWP